jgi:hypothetical protein
VFRTSGAPGGAGRGTYAAGRRRAVAASDALRYIRTLGFPGEASTVRVMCV